ncbi:MAG TPA: hypothetical protein VMB05_07620 [Solirubrobacteraceae bacterium]|nr:hypothetical protein [Solirubrobacteraceae bacterium]
MRSALHNKDFAARDRAICAARVVRGQGDEGRCVPQARAVAHSLAGIATGGHGARSERAGSRSVITERKRSSGKVRHVRMLGLCLAAALLVSAFGAGSALANNKDPYSVNTWAQYKYCPFNNAEWQAAFYHECYVGRTSGGANGGYFQLGNVTVKLNKPIILHGGFIDRSFAEEKEINEERKECEANPSYSPECEVAEKAPEGFAKYWYYKIGNLKVIPAENGGETLEAPELKVPKGLKLVTPKIQENQDWPAELKAAFKEATKNHEAGLNVKIEVAGNSLFEKWGGLNTSRILLEQGPAFVLPLKVRLINPWLEKLGGGPCELGNDAHPIIQNLSSEPPGRAAERYGISFNEEFTQTGIKGSRLADLNWPVPPGAEATGCGGSYESYVDGAINEVLELPRAHGITVLQGDLFTAVGEVTLEEGEKTGELP